MASEHNSYISNLVVTHSKNKIGKSLKDMKNHERKMSYVTNLGDDEIMYTTSARNHPTKARNEQNHESINVYYQ
jgi:hypothetical protein